MNNHFPKKVSLNRFTNSSYIHSVWNLPRFYLLSRTCSCLHLLYVFISIHLITTEVEYFSHFCWLFLFFFFFFFFILPFSLFFFSFSLWLILFFFFSFVYVWIVYSLFLSEFVLDHFFLLIYRSVLYLDFKILPL